MNIDSEEFREDVFNLLNGYYNLAVYTSPVGCLVENLFTKGSACLELYGEMLDAYERLCERLGTGESEDSDVGDYQ